MRLTNLDTDTLRSFVAGIDLASFGRAATKLGRSPSAISLQMRKLEEQVGRPLFLKKGRGLALTDAGEMLLGYARRILDMNDAALVALRAEPIVGEVRLGLPQDFAETSLPSSLARFSGLHPGVRVSARVERNDVLRSAFEAGELDLALLWNSASPGAERMAELPMAWIGPRAGFLRDPGHPLPLVAFDAPCLFRRAAVEALDGAGIPWRLSFTSPSLSGLWAAVAAGLGVTARTPHGVPQALAPTRRTAGLPSLPNLSLALLHASPRSLASEHLASTLRETFSSITP
jgi:DNA-binding transcriptional LysR family regulator